MFLFEVLLHNIVLPLCATALKDSEILQKEKRKQNLQQKIGYIYS